MIWNICKPFYHDNIIYVMAHKYIKKVEQDLFDIGDLTNYILETKVLRSIRIL
jgi:hypothetical protein